MPPAKTKTTGTEPEAEQAEARESEAASSTNYEPIKTDDVFEDLNIMEVSSCGSITTVRTTFKHVPSIIDHFVKKGWAFLGVSESPLRHAVLIFKSK